MLQEREIVEIRDPAISVVFDLGGPRYFVYDRGEYSPNMFELLAQRYSQNEMQGPSYPFWIREWSFWDFGSGLIPTFREIALEYQQELRELGDGEHMRRLKHTPRNDLFMYSSYFVTIFRRDKESFEIGLCQYKESQAGNTEYIERRRIDAAAQFANIERILRLPREPFLGALAEAVRQEISFIGELGVISSCSKSEGRWEAWLESPHPIARAVILSNLSTPDEVVAELAKDPSLQQMLLSRLELPREAFLPIIEDPSRWNDSVRRHRSMPADLLAIMGRGYSIRDNADDIENAGIADTAEDADMLEVASLADPRVHVDRFLGEPSPAHWEGLCVVVMDAYKREPATVRERWIPYLERMLAAWPAHLRPVPLGLFVELEHRARFSVACRLSRTLTLGEVASADDVFTRALRPRHT